MKPLGWLQNWVGLAGVILVVLSGVIVIYSQTAVMQAAINEITSNELPHIQKRLDDIQRTQMRLLEMSISHDERLKALEKRPVE